MQIKKMAMVKACTKTDMHNHLADHSRSATHLHFCREALVNSESSAQIQLADLPLYLVVLLLAHDGLAENVMNVGEVNHENSFVSLRCW